MRTPRIVLAAVVMLAFGAACGKNVPPPPPPAAPAAPPPAPQPKPAEANPELDEYARVRGMTPDQIDALNLFKDVYFDLDTADIREDGRSALAANADVLRRFDFLTVRIEGHCDERGTVEYNLALGERRSRSARDYLVSLGVDAHRLELVSYGKEVPSCREQREDCWARNRRARSGVVAVASR